MVYCSFAKIVRPKRKLPAAPLSAGEFFSSSLRTRRQMRMYAQIFYNARKKLKKSFGDMSEFDSGVGSCLLEE